MLRGFAAGLIVAGAFSLALLPSQARADSNAKARVALAKTLPAIDFNNVPVKDALDFIRDVSGTNVHINWRAIEASGVTPDTTINIRLRQVSAGKVLSLLLNEASGGTGSLTYYLEDGVVEVTTKEQSDTQMITIVYPVEDLLYEPPEFIEPPDFGLPNESTVGTGRGSGLSGRGTGISSRSNNAGPRGPARPGQGKTAADSKRDRADELVQLIVDTVQPEIWTQNGGKASIRIFNGNLVVTAPRSAHEAIGGPVD
jgi:hypothetical protein